MAPGHFEIASNFPPLHPSRLHPNFASRLHQFSIHGGRNFLQLINLSQGEEFRLFAHQQNLATLRSPAKSLLLVGYR